jgi:threonine dehydratase
MIGPADISEAARAIAPFVRRTPVIEIAAADLGVAGEPVVLKLELFQHTGSFKARGAFANLLLRDVPPAGVVAASGGNHGAAVAYAAHRRGHAATIFVPSISSPAKVSRIRGYGAELVIAGDRYAEAWAASTAWAERTGALLVPPFDRRETMMGAGTTGLELDGQVPGLRGPNAEPGLRGPNAEPGLDTVLVAVGGGGLVAGIAAWFGGRVKVVGVEPEAAPTLTRALAAGRPVDAPAGGVAADALAPDRVGDLVLPVVQAHGVTTVLVPDDEILRAQRLLWDGVRVVAEPAGATALAALVSGRYRPEPTERVAVIISGGNTGAVTFATTT